MSFHGTYIALGPSLDGKELTAFKAVVLSSALVVRKKAAWKKLYSDLGVLR